MQSLVGSRLGHYRIDSALGEGGMGAVYRGWDTSLSRPVAVKVMHPQFAGQREFRERFLQEAKAPARLSHPSIVHIYDFGSQQSVLYIVMEYVEGSNLSSHIRQAGELEQVVHLKETLVVLAQVADALAFAHRSGVIHRDIKPDNILLRRLERPDRESDPPLRAMVTDFGLAKLLEGGVSTQTGAFLGTLSYMSPEQCFGRPLDGRTDIYSLGVVLYRLTTGRLPLEIQSPTDAILKHQNVTPPAPRELQPGIPARIEAIIQRSIAKDPGDRYQEAGALYDELRRAAEMLTEGELTAYAATELVHSFVTHPQQQAGPRPERPDDFAAAGILKGKSPGNRIHIMIPDRTIRTLNVEVGSLTVGRGEDCEIKIDDPSISRHHARIEFDGRQFTVTDLKSTNGTFLEETPLLAGVRETWNPEKLLRLGGTWLRLDVAAPAPSAPPVFSQVPPASAFESEMTRHSSMSGWISIFLAQTAFTLPQGGGCSIPVMVLNQGAIVDHFGVSLQGLPPEWQPPSPAEVHLMPGVRGETTLQLPPPPPRFQAGTYQARLVVVGRASPDEIAVADITLQVNPRYAFEMSLQPVRRRSLTAPGFTLAVENSGNADVTLNLSGQDPENVCRFTFTPNPVSVPPGGRAESALQVSSTLKVPGWGSRTHALTVTAAAADGTTAPKQVQGEWEQVAPEFLLRLEPQNQQSSPPGVFSVELSTFSPDPVEVLLEAGDPEDACTYKISPSRIRLDADQTSRAGLQVVPREKDHAGQVTFTLTGSLAPAPHLQQTVSGTWEPVPPPAPKPETLDLPEEVTLKGDIPLPEPVHQQPGGSSGTQGCLVLLVGLGLTVPAGLLAGNIVFEGIVREDIWAWAAAIAVWLIGLRISISLFNRARRPPGA